MINQNNSWTSTIPSSVPSGPYLIRFETIALHSLPAVSCHASFYSVQLQLIILPSSNFTPSVLKFKSLVEDLGLLWPLNSSLSQVVTATAIQDVSIDLFNIVNQADNLDSDCRSLLQLCKNRVRRHSIIAACRHHTNLHPRTNYVIPGPPLYGSGGSVSTRCHSSTFCGDRQYFQGPVTSNPVTTKPPTSTVPSTTAVPSTTSTAAAGTVTHYGQCGGQDYTGPTGWYAFAGWNYQI